MKLHDHATIPDSDDALQGIRCRPMPYRRVSASGIGDRRGDVLVAVRAPERCGVNRDLLGDLTCGTPHSFASGPSRPSSEGLDRDRDWVGLVTLPALVVALPVRDILHRIASRAFSAAMPAGAAGSFGLWHSTMMLPMTPRKNPQNADSVVSRFFRFPIATQIAALATAPEGQPYPESAHIIPLL